MLQILPNHPFQVRCDCESLKELAALVDFEHVVPRDHALERGAVLFRKGPYIKDVSRVRGGVCQLLTKGREVA